MNILLKTPLAIGALVLGPVAVALLKWKFPTLSNKVKPAISTVTTGLASYLINHDVSASLLLGVAGIGIRENVSQLLQTFGLSKAAAKLNSLPS